MDDIPAGRVSPALTEVIEENNEDLHPGEQVLKEDETRRINNSEEGQSNIWRKAFMQLYHQHNNSLAAIRRKNIRISNLKHLVKKLETISGVEAEIPGNVYETPQVTRKQGQIPLITLEPESVSHLVSSADDDSGLTSSPQQNHANVIRIPDNLRVVLHRLTVFPMQNFRRTETVLPNGSSMEASPQRHSARAAETAVAASSRRRRRPAGTATGSHPKRRTKPTDSKLRTIISRSIAARTRSSHSFKRNQRKINARNCCIYC